MNKATLKRDIPIALITFVLATFWMDWCIKNNISVFATFANGLIGGFVLTVLLTTWYGKPDTPENKSQDTEGK